MSPKAHCFDASLVVDLMLTPPKPQSGDKRSLPHGDMIWCNDEISSLIVNAIQKSCKCGWWGSSWCSNFDWNIHPCRGIPTYLHESLYKSIIYMSLSSCQNDAQCKCKILRKVTPNFGDAMRLSWGSSAEMALLEKKKKRKKTEKQKPMKWSMNQY